MYGASRPGGAFNLTSKCAILNGRQKIATFTVGSYDKRRAKLDLAFPLGWLDSVCFGVFRGQIAVTFAGDAVDVYFTMRGRFEFSHIL